MKTVYEVSSRRAARIREPVIYDHNLKQSSVPYQSVIKMGRRCTERSKVLYLSEGDENEQAHEANEEQEADHPQQPGFLHIVRIVFFSCLAGDPLAHAKQVAPKAT